VGVDCRFRAFVARGRKCVLIFV